MAWLADGELLVVETEDDWFLGTVELTAGGLVIRSGFVGRPTVLSAEAVSRIAPLEEYEDSSLEAD